MIKFGRASKARTFTARLATLLVWAGGATVLVGGVAAYVAGPGYQADFWHYRTGFTILRWAVYAAAVGGMLAVLGLAMLRPVSRISALGVLVALAAVAIALPAWQLQETAAMVPPIHDVTTDTEHPPQFEALLAVRRETSNGPEYRRTKSRGRAESRLSRHQAGAASGTAGPCFRTCIGRGARHGLGNRG